MTDDAVKLRLPKRVFNDVYLPVLEKQERYIHLYGGAGSGKSHFAAGRELLKSFEEYQRTLVVRKVNKTIRNSVQALLRDVASSWKVKGGGTVAKFFQFQQGEIINKLTGNRMILTGLDDPEKIKSIAGITRLWIEEATELTQEDYQQLDLRLRGYDSLQITFSYNPIDEEHWLNNVFHKKLSPDTYVLKTTYKDNKFIDDHYRRVLERLKDQDPNYYKIYALGEWGGLVKGLVYPSVRFVDDFPQDCKWISYGLDFGFTNDFCSLVRVGYRDGELFVRELFYEVGMTNRDIANRLRYLGVDKTEVIWADSAEPKSIAELQHFGFNVRAVKKGEINYGIDLIKQYPLNCTKDSPNLHKEFRKYKWEEDKDGKLLNRPVDLYNHGMDAMRYAFLMKLPGRGFFVK